MRRFCQLRVVGIVLLGWATGVARRDGLIVYLKAYAQREDALSDLGVSEAELEPIEP